MSVEIGPIEIDRVFTCGPMHVAWIGSLVVGFDGDRVLVALTCAGTDGQSHADRFERDRVAKVTAHRARQLAKYKTSYRERNLELVRQKDRDRKRKQSQAKRAHEAMAGL